MNKTPNEQTENETSERRGGRFRGAKIRSMAVYPSMRGHGIGKLLLARVEDFACASGYKRLILNTTPFMNRAIRLYEAFGFEFTGIEQNWFGTPIRTMTKEVTLVRS
jgi:GNAT superfamily N-acetyltransferase